MGGTGILPVPLSIEEGNMPKYDVVVKLIGRDGNSFTILGAVQRALREADVPKEEIDAFFKEAMAGNYDHLLRTVMETVNVK